MKLLIANQSKEKENNIANFVKKNNAKLFCNILKNMKAKSE